MNYLVELLDWKEEEFLIEQQLKDEFENLGQTMETINSTQLQRIRDA